MLRCKEIYERSCQVIPGGVNSPVRAFKKVGGTPLIVTSGAGEMIRDADGREYIDYCGSWGAAIMGHAHPEISTAAIQQIHHGSSFGIATEIEEKMARRVVSLMPNVEKVRFVSSGTEATMTAIRLARGFTGRSKIVKFIGCYHGHSDGLLVQAGSGALDLQVGGLPQGAVQDTICLPFNDEEAVRTLFADQGEEIAALIVEPIPANMGVTLPKAGFLEALREVTQQVNAVLIFDEVITGFRVALGGAQELYGIKPDLTCLGKAVGGGFPVAAVGGKREIMDLLAPLGTVYQAGTLSGNPVAMAAGLAALTCIQQPHFYQKLEEKTRRLTDPIRGALPKSCSLVQAGSMFTLFFETAEQFAHFFHYLLKEGVYIPPYQQEAWFVSSAHREETLERSATLITRFFNRLF